MAIFTGFELFDLRDVSNGQIQSSAINLGSTGNWMIPQEVITAANNSGELLSGHIMYARANNGRLPTLNMSEESINFSQVYTVGHTNILFPITRVLNPNSVKVTVRCAGSNDGYWCGALEIGKVVNGEFVKYETSAYANRPSYNTDVNLLLDNLSSFEYIDYIVINCSNSSWAFKNIEIDGTVVLPITSNGGGATHIAKVTGQLKDLSSNLSDILMVSGGGGGGLLAGDTDYSGKEAGGISGSGDNSADQTTGNAFGQGESGTDVSGGGSGLYGGYKGTSAKSGGAGSGYIGNSLVSNKKMVGYNVPTSSAEGTKTESVNEVSASAVSGKPKSGNGFARIKFLRDIKITFNNMIAFPEDDEEVFCFNYSWGTATNFSIGTLKSTFAGRGNSFFLLGDDEATLQPCVVLPYNITDGSSIYFGSNQFVTELGDNQTYYGMTSPQSLEVFFGNGSPAYASRTYTDGITKDGIFYRHNGGTSINPLYFVSTANNISVYVDGVLKAVYNPS